jgi:kumamolisin
MPELTIVLRRGEGVGADPADVATVRAALTRAGLVTTREHLASRRLWVSSDPASVHAALDGVGSAVLAVLGEDTRPVARPHYRVAATVQSSYTPVQVGQLYGFPPGYDGAGQTVAIVELGGGFATSDLAAYFAGLGLPVPAVSAVGVDGAVNQPGQDPGGADGEVLLDIEVVGALAPGAGIVVYFAPNTDQGFVDAVSDATHAAPTPTALSISWGGPESGWATASRAALDAALADAAALGVSVTVAAGDNGSNDGTAAPMVDFPASSPHVLGCGGTSLQTRAGTGAGPAISAEVVWDDTATGGGATGGGVSAGFPVPAWQQGLTADGTPLTGRGVPDVAGDADPATGYQVRVDGTAEVIGGTSAVAPLWAALIARLAQAHGGPLGLVNPLLYAHASALRDITSGGNGAYTATTGWDPCTGLGSPDGAALLALVLRPGAPPPPA